MTSSLHDHQQLGAGVATEVSDGVFAYIQPDGSWWINNTGFLVGERGVISVDACSTLRRTSAYLDTIASVSSQPVRTLINTHHHGDHTFGNQLFAGATIVGHENCREAVIKAGLPYDLPVWNEVEWGAVEVTPPFLTYREGITLHCDDLVAEVSYVGTPAHTTNDSIVWLPEREVLFTGDLLFNQGTPFLLMGSIAGAIDVLTNTVKKIPAKTLVPGHGPVCGPEVIDEVLGYLNFVQDLAAQGIAAGLTPLDLARETDLGDYAGLLDAERIVGNLHRAYAELNGLARGGQIDTRAALLDMVTYNGGQPLSCYA